MASSSILYRHFSQINHDFLNTTRPRRLNAPSPCLREEQIQINASQRGSPLCLELRQSLEEFSQARIRSHTWSNPRIHHLCFDRSTLTLSRAFDVAQILSLPPLRHSSPVTAAPLLAVSPKMISRSLFWELNQLRMKVAGSSLSELKKECLACETAMACTRRPSWPSSS